MLSRDADACLWIGRYIERAEATARLIDVHYHFRLEMPAAETAIRWNSILSITGGTDAYDENYESHDERSVLNFIAFDVGNPDSIYSCVRAARENARSIRELISSEMWESLNFTYLELGNWDLDRMLRDSPHSFFHWVRNRSHLFQGITNRTLMMGESRDFLDTGRFLERAGQTARILDAKYHDLLPADTVAGGPVDIHGWIAVLKSVGAYEAYRKTYQGGVTPERVAGFLILNTQFPASVRHSISRVEGCLKRISGSKSDEPVNAAERAIGRLSHDLTYTTEDEIASQGLHSFLLDVMDRCDAIGSAIGETYLRY